MARIAGLWRETRLACASLPLRCHRSPALSRIELLGVVLVVCVWVASLQWRGCVWPAALLLPLLVGVATGSQPPPPRLAPQSSGGSAKWNKNSVFHVCGDVDRAMRAAGDAGEVRTLSRACSGRGCVGDSQRRLQCAPHGMSFYCAALHLCCRPRVVVMSARDASLVAIGL
jgi:hypothetical protein